MDTGAGEPGSELSENEERLLGLLRDGHPEEEIGVRLGLPSEGVRPLVHALLDRLRLDRMGSLAWPDPLPIHSRDAGSNRYMNFDPSLGIPVVLGRVFGRWFLARG